MANQRQQNLEKFLQPLINRSSTIPKIRAEDLSDTQLKNIEAIYKKLGGVLEKPPINYGKYDIILKDKVVEVDEENHFNRYREITLTSPFYKSHKGFDTSAYKSYCHLYESKCRSYGKFWSSPSTEKQFGKAGTNGDFSNGGSSRWKQRAYYDFIKDHLKEVYNIPVIRLSIYDQLNGVTLHEILTKNKTEFSSALIDKIESYEA